MDPNLLWKWITEELNELTADPKDVHIRRMAIRHLEDLIQHLTHNGAPPWIDVPHYT